MNDTASCSAQIDRLLRTLQMEIKDGSAVVDRIEVFNSAEVQAPGIESVPTRLRSKEPTGQPTRGGVLRLTRRGGFSLYHTILYDRVLV